MEVTKKLKLTLLLVLFQIAMSCQLMALSAGKPGALNMLDEVAEEEVVEQVEHTYQRNWTFDINGLTSKSQALFNTTGTITIDYLDRLEQELTSECPLAEQRLLRAVMQKARQYVTKGQSHRANALLRGYASKVEAAGLTDIVLTAKGVYESPLSTVELPIIPGATIKVGWPLSEVYIGSAKNYEKGGILEGHEPLFVDTEIMALTSTPLSTTIFPTLGVISSVVDGIEGSGKIANTISAPIQARYYAQKNAGISFEQFNDYYEEEVVPQYRIPGTNLAYRVTYKLKNKKTGEQFESSFSMGDVASVASLVTKATNSVIVSQAGTAADQALDGVNTIESFIAPLAGGE